MPTITVRVDHAEKADVERRAAATGLDLSGFVRRALDIERDAPDISGRLEAVERRIATLEQIAGLE